MKSKEKKKRTKFNEIKSSKREVLERKGHTGTCQWTGGRCVRSGFLVRRKKEEREEEEASHAHVITNAAGIHDPRHLAPSSSTPLRLTTTVVVAILLFSVHQTPPRRGVCTRAKRGPTTKRRTQNVPPALRSGFTDDTYRAMSEGTRKHTAEKPRLRAESRMSNPCCLIPLEDAPRGKSIDRL